VTVVLPDPMTPADCDLQDFPFMPLMVSRLRKSKAWVKARRNPALGFYMVNLWAQAWHEVPAGSLEDDDDVLADAAMCDPSKWDKVKAGALYGWVKCSDGRLYHPIVCERVLEAWAAKEERREKNEHERDRKRSEREERAQHFATLKAAGIHRPWNTSLADLRSAIHDLSAGQATDNTPPVQHLSRLGEGQGEGQGEKYSAPTGAGSAGAAPPMADGPELDPEAKRVLWRDSRDWLVANGVPPKDAKTFINVLAGEHPAVIVAALQEALKTPAPADAKSFLSGIAKHKAGERARPKPAVTVESNAADVTLQQLNARSSQPLAEAARAAAAESMQAVTAALRAKAGLGPAPAAAPKSEIAEVTDGGT